MDWTLADIKIKVRKLTGRPDFGQLSDSELTDAINQYYVNMLPQEVCAREIQTWFTLTATDSDDGNYGLTGSVLALDEPFTVRDADGIITTMAMTTDPELFFYAYPESNTQKGRPKACLLYNRTLYVRPKPDGQYTIKALGAKIPVALTHDSEQPADTKWGPLIAYGAAIEILQENGENAEADSLKDLYGYHLISIARKQLQQIPTRKRARPGF